MGGGDAGITSVEKKRRILLMELQRTSPAKNPGVAAVLSFFFSGLGQIYNGQILKGLLFMAVQVVNFVLSFVVIGLFTGFVVWVWAIADAYTSAELLNTRGGLR